MPKLTYRWAPAVQAKQNRLLLCHAFTVVVENESKATVRLSSYCKEPVLVIWIKQPRSSGGWFPVSQRRDCHGDEHWTNTRLQPHEKTLIETRLISPSRNGGPLLPGYYALRASLTLWGCIEPPDHTDCLSPLQVVTPPSSDAMIDAQEPVEVISNEISAESPPLTNLGKMKFRFQVQISAVAPENLPSKKGCTSEKSANPDCTVFHYSIGNLGRSAVRYGYGTCEGLVIAPEYRQSRGKWTRLHPRGGACAGNESLQTAVLSGKASQGEFTIGTLGFGYDTTPLKMVGIYQLRFRWWPRPCFASPDGRFCLTEIEHANPVASSALMIHSQC